MIKNDTNANKSAFEQQAELLLSELDTILTDKWPTLNNTGCILIKRLLDLYSDVASTKSQEDSSEDATLNFTASTLISLRQCNDTFEKLDELLVNFSFYLNKLRKINANLISLNGSDIDIFRQINFTCLKAEIADVCQSLQKEFTFKSVLVKNHLFEARLEQSLQPAVMSAWMHEPFMDELKIFKIHTVLTNYKNLNKK